MSIHTLTLTEVERAIRNLNPEKQRKLLIKLPSLLKLKSDELKLLKLTESSFKFWDNKEDSVYDSL